MRKILLTSTIINLFGSLDPLHAMQAHPSSQGAWIRPALTGATAFGGLLTAGYFWNKNRTLSKPKKFKKVTIDHAQLQTATQNITLLQQIQEDGKKLKPKTDDHVKLKNQFDGLDFEQESDRNNKRNRAQIYDSLHLFPTQYFLSTAFAAKKEEREKIKTRSNEILMGPEGAKNAIFIANTVDEMLEHQNIVKREREKEMQEQIEQAQNRRLEYIQKNNHYKSQCTKNRAYVYLALHFTGIATTLFCLSKKK